MTKRCIGIDIGPVYLRAVQMSRNDGQFTIEKTVRVQTRRKTDSPSDIVRSLVRQNGFDLHAEVAVSMPRNAVYFRNLETDFAGLEQIRKSSSRALEHNFPIQRDEIVSQVCSYRTLPGDKYSALTAAAGRASIHERLKTLTAAGMQPELVETASLAVYSAIAVNHPEITTGRAVFVYIEESYLTLAVLEDNQLLMVRSIPAPISSDGNIASVQELTAELLSRETQITWRKVFGGEIGRDVNIYLALGADDFSSFRAVVEEKLPCRIIIVDPYAKVECNPDSKGDSAIWVAEGLALRALASDKTKGVNFLQADTLITRPRLNLKKELLTYFALVATIVVVSLVGLFTHLSHLERKYAQIQSESKKIFQAALPEEKNIVNPLAQLEQKLKSVRKDSQIFAPFSGSDLSPLQLLQTLTTSVPRQGNVKLNEMLVTYESVRLSGSCNSFESAYKWQSLLQKNPAFKFVDVKDVQKQPDSGTVSFVILISLTTPEQK